MKHLTRQIEIIPMNRLNVPVTIIGAGAIGSFTALSLAKMGMTNLTVWDKDNIEMENMNSQFYRQKDLGRPKVNALQGLILEFTGQAINAIPNFFGVSDVPSEGIVITAVDSMEARQMLWDRHKEHVRTHFFIDPRMSAEHALLYAMDPNSSKDIESYEKTLYSDEKALHERCTAKATMYTALLLSGLTCKAVKDFIVDEPKRLRMAMWNIKDNELLCYAKNNEVMQ